MLGIIASFPCFLNPAKEREVSDTFTLKTLGGMGYPGGGVEFLSASLGRIYNSACFKRLFLSEYLLGPSFAVQVLLNYILTAHVQARIFGAALWAHLLPEHLLPASLPTLPLAHLFPAYSWPLTLGV